MSHNVIATVLELTKKNSLLVQMYNYKVIFFGKVFCHFFPPFKLKNYTGSDDTYTYILTHNTVHHSPLCRNTPLSTIAVRATIYTVSISVRFVVHQNRYSSSRQISDLSETLIFTAFHIVTVTYHLLSYIICKYIFLIFDISKTLSFFTICCSDGALLCWRDNKSITSSQPLIKSGISDKCMPRNFCVFVLCNVPPLQFRACKESPTARWIQDESPILTYHHRHLRSVVTINDGLWGGRELLFWLCTQISSTSRW